MILEIKDGREGLYQWDTGRYLTVNDNTVTQVHFSNDVSETPYTVNVADGVVGIPDELLQDWHTLIAYVYIADTTGGYTKVQLEFYIHKRPKPADYVYTPTERADFDALRKKIGDLNDLQTDAKDTLVAAINEAAASGGADWTQNDPTAKDYVKNRPGGYDVVTPEKIISEWGMHGSNYVSIELSEPLIEGRSYRLTFSENADYSNPVFDSEVVASINETNDSTQKGSIYVTVKGYASVVQPVTYPEDSVIYSCNNDCRTGHCRLIALANTETVKIPDKYISQAFFEIKASSNEDDDENGKFTVIADKSKEEVLDAVKRGKVPYVNLDDDVFLWPTAYGNFGFFVSLVPTDPVFTLMLAVRIDGENSVGIAIRLPTAYVTGNPVNLGTSVKDNLVAAINEVNEKASKSSNAVLYTAQTLTDEQKKQARENIEALGKNSVHYMYQSDTHTNDIYKLAFSGPIGFITGSGGGVLRTPVTVIFGSTEQGRIDTFAIDFNGDMYHTTLNLSSMPKPVWTKIEQLRLNDDGALPQQTMASAPAKDMQIATKKYVDEKEVILKSTTPGSTKKFKITVDDSGTITTMEV